MNLSYSALNSFPAFVALFDVVDLLCTDIPEGRTLTGYGSYAGRWLLRKTGTSQRIPTLVFHQRQLLLLDIQYF